MRFQILQELVLIAFVSLLVVFWWEGGLEFPMHNILLCYSLCYMLLNNIPQLFSKLEFFHFISELDLQLKTKVSTPLQDISVEKTSNGIKLVRFPRVNFPSTSGPEAQHPWELYEINAIHSTKESMKRFSEHQEYEEHSKLISNLFLLRDLTNKHPDICNSAVVTSTVVEVQFNLNNYQENSLRCSVKV